MKTNYLCPAYNPPMDSVWKQLPGGPVAECNGETWEYMGSDEKNGLKTHFFRHRDFNGLGEKRVKIEEKTGG